MSTLAILQVRLSSTRLPGKVLKPILGRPMLGLHIERLRRTKTLNRLVVATGDDIEDDAIEALCDEIGVDCFRGSLDDVLDRCYRCAQAYGPTHIARLTGDCPLADPDIIDRVVSLHLKGGYDYTSNILPPTWPDGMDVEVMRFACLAEAHAEAELPSEREHVTPFIRNRPERYRHGNLNNDRDLSAHRLTVDEPEDFEKIRRIYETLYLQKPDFSINDVLTLLDDNDELSELNAHIARNEGTSRSESKDRELTRN